MTEEILFSRFTVVRRLGRGGVGTVFLVEDGERPGEKLALKLVDLPESDEDPYELVRHEFFVLARHDHPCLARAFEIGREGKRAWFTMEAVSGTDLLEASAALDVQGVLSLSVQLLHALSFIHGLGLVHGDVKPQNVLVDLSGKAPSLCLLDFGLVESIFERGSRTPLLSGTPAYFPPEKALGADPDPRSDLYSFGVTLFQLLAGRLPYSARSAQDFIDAHRYEEAPDLRKIDPSIPEVVARICGRLLEKEPNRRFQNAEAVITALSPLIPGLSPGSVAHWRKSVVSETFVGRAGALAGLEKKITPSLDGTGPPAVVAVLSPAGMGKTRLVREARLNARVRGHRVVELSADAKGGDPLGPVRELVEPLAGHVDSLDARLGEPVRNLLAGKIDPSRDVVRLRPRPCWWSSPPDSRWPPRAGGLSCSRRGKVSTIPTRGGSSGKGSSTAPSRPWT
jgi:hypothetical protein